MALYTILPCPRDARRFRVSRDGAEVASIFDDPTLHGGDRVVYTGAPASVSLSAVIWAGEHPPMRDARFHDFISTHQRAPDVLPEVEERVEALLAWRTERKG